MRFRSRLVPPVLVLVALLVASTAHAQDPTRDRVQIALDLTDRRIEQAQTLLSSSDNANAGTELNVAIDLQARAKNAFAATQLRISLSLTLQARGHADKAIAIIKGLPDPDRVQVQLERTRELIERARDRIEECESDRAHALLRVALEMQVRAEGAAGDGRYLAALQLTLSARERALKALRACNLEDNLRESAERALARTDVVIGRAHDRVADAGNEAARAALSRAMDLEAQAQSQFRVEHFDASLRLTLSARALAQRAIRLCTPRS
jgi:tetratricopeptide (TPR) repeat protein